MILQIAAGILGFVIAFAMMPWVMSVAREFQLLDYPDNERRVHATPVPRLGGVAIFAATALAAATVFGIDAWDPAVTIPRGTILPGVVLGCLIVFVTGIV